MGTMLRLSVLALVLGYCRCVIPKILYEGVVEAECLDISRGERGRFLPFTMENNGNAILLARHHIIPVNRLRQFFNTALERNNQDNYELSMLITLIGQLAQNGLDFYHENNSPVDDAIRDHLTVARNVQVNYTYGFGDPPIDRLFDITVVIRNMFLWMPANIFWGPIPRLRTDDPGDNFETNAGHIIGDRYFEMLQRINQRMIDYIANDDRRTFYQIMTELQILANRQHTPYVFQLNQWDVTQRNGRDAYNIRLARNRRSVSKRSTLSRQDDPLCLKPLENLKLILQEKNLVIAAAAIERVRRGQKFNSRNYASWKEWYNSSDWSGPYNGIYWNGRSKAGAGIWYNAFGQVYNDGSFAVGITGMDTKLGNDNWVTERGGDWDASNKDGYCGEMYFDKNGRPVALVMTSRFYGDFGSGWSFVYNNGRWEYESTDDWHERRFNGRTESLDPHAPVFLIDRP